MPPGIETWGFAENLSALNAGQIAMTISWPPLGRWTQGVNWQVARDGVQFADNPSFEAWMPNYQEAFASVVTFGDTMRTDGSLDIDAAIDDFVEELQAIFDSAE